MANLFDFLGNELVGFPDQVTNKALTQKPALTANLNTVNAEAYCDLSGQSTLAVDLRGTFVGTVQFEGTVDGTNYVVLPGINQASQAFVTTATAPGAFIISVAGYQRVRVRCTAYTSGTITVAMRASQGLQMLLTQSVPSIPATNTGATGAAVTLTLAAPGAGLFHYISSITLQRIATAVLTPAATPLVVTTTNLPGSLAFSAPADAAAQGVMHEQRFEPKEPIKSTTANTASTIVCPATTGVIWRVTATYRTGA